MLNADGSIDAAFGQWPVDDLVAFRYSAGTWIQIPLQVDEREVVNLGTAYDAAKSTDPDPRDDPIGRPITCPNPFYCQNLIQPELTFPYFIDEGTHTAQVENAAPIMERTLSPMDEIVFMARDAGVEAAPEDAPLPAGVVDASGIELTISHPSLSEPAYAYLFLRDPAASPQLAQDADTSYVRYDFHLCTFNPDDLARPDCSLPSLDYREAYNLPGLDKDDYGTPGQYDNMGERLGANPEDTYVEGETYRVHFSDRSIMDDLMVRTDPTAAFGADLLDRRKMQFGPTDCNRNEFTASVEEGAFVTNKAGPIRVIRTAIGFNSGPLVTREDVFYGRYSRSTLALRVHQISGLMDVYDYSPAATDGLTYYDNLLGLTGDPIDGDGTRYTYGESELAWNAVRGQPAGGPTLVHVFELDETIDGAQEVGLGGGTYALSMERYYEDAATPQTLQCTGDEAAYGFSGAYVSGSYTPVGWGPSYQRIGNTDPRLDEGVWYNTLFELALTRHTLYEGTYLNDAELSTFTDTASDTLTVSQAVYPRAALAGDSSEHHHRRRGFSGDMRQTFGLYPPAPNPATTRTSLRYTLPEATQVRLTLYDTLGRRRARVLKAFQRAGTHEVNVDVSALPEGVYFVHLQAGARRATGSVIKH